MRHAPSLMEGMAFCFKCTGCVDIFKTYVEVKEEKMNNQQEQATMLIFYISNERPEIY